MRSVRSGRQTLDYGSAQTVSLGSVVRRSLWAILILAAVLTALVIGYRYAYLYPETSVRSYLQSLKGTGAIRINSYDDGPAVKVLFASVELTGTPARSFSMHVPTRDELRSGSHLRVFTFGPYEFQATNKLGYQTLDVGRDGPFANLFPFAVHNPQDLIDHYDEIIQFLESDSGWREHIAPDGGRCHWRVRNVSWTPGGR